MSNTLSQSNRSRRALLLVLAAFAAMAAWPAPSSLAPPGAAAAVRGDDPLPDPYEDDDDLLWEILIRLLQLTYERLSQMQPPIPSPENAGGWITLIADDYAVQGAPAGLSEPQRLATLQTLRSTHQWVAFFADELDPLQVLQVQGVIEDAYAQLGGQTGDLD